MAYSRVKFTLTWHVKPLKCNISTIMSLLTTFTLPTSSIWRVFLHRSTTFVALTVTAIHTAVVGVKTACFHVTAQQDLGRICYLSFLSLSSLKRETMCSTETWHLFTKLQGVTLHKAVIFTSNKCLHFIYFYRICVFLSAVRSWGLCAAEW